MLQSMGSQRVRHDLATEHQQQQMFSPKKRREKRKMSLDVNKFGESE